MSSSKRSTPMSTATSPTSQAHNLRSTKTISTRHNHSTNEVPPSSTPTQTAEQIELTPNDNDSTNKSTESLYQRIKKRPISGVLNSDTDSELTWFANLHNFI